MPTVEKLRYWSYQKQLLNQQGADLPSVLSSIIAVYSTHPSGPLSLLARSASFSQEAFLALDTNKHALRIPCMRLSVHLVPIAAAQQLFSATLPTASSGHFEKRYSEDGRKVPVELYPGWVAALTKVLATPKAVKELKPLDIVPADKLKFVLNRMGFEGYTVRVGAPSLRSNLISYAATEAWAGAPLLETDAAAAPHWLAGEYFRVFGPARVKDFQWWAGITAGAAKAAVDKLDTAFIDDDLLLLKSEQAAFEAFEPAAHNNIDILPQWDAYTMGYPADGRARFIKAEHVPTLYGKLGATGGNALGAVMIAGQAEAMWTSRFKGTIMEIDITVFEKLTAAVKKKIAKRFEAIAGLLSAKKVAINWK